jgi:DHA1 family tetracycline resistance protein-like MFS transporter
MPLPFVIVLFIVALDAMSIGVVLPVMPQLIASVRGGTAGDAAMWSGVLSSAFAVSQFLFSPLLGALSDRFGRRPVLLLSLLVMAVDYVVMALAETVWLLLAARIVSGMAAATYVVALASAADVTPGERRARGFGLVSAAFGLGLILGPVAGGLAGEMHPRAPFALAAILAGAIFLVALAALPETLPTERRRAFDHRRANPIGSLAAIGRLPGLLPLVVAFAFLQSAVFVYPAVWAFYVEANLRWTTGAIGLSLALYGLAAAVAQAGAAPLLVYRLSEAGAAKAAMALGVLCLAGYGFADSAALVWALVPLSALASVATPALQGLVSRKAGVDQQGELQGALGSLSALAMIASPLIMTGAFFWGVRPDATLWLPGAPFLVAALFMAAGLAVLAVSSQPRLLRAPSAA